MEVTGFIIIILSFLLAVSVSGVIFLLLKLKKLKKQLKVSKHEELQPIFKKSPGKEKIDVEKGPKAIELGTLKEKAEADPKKVDDKQMEKPKKLALSREMSREAMRSENDVAPPEKMQRSERQKLMEPVARNEFIDGMNMVVSFINDYFDESQKHSVIPDTSAKYEKLQKPIPENADSCKRIIEDLNMVIVPSMCHTRHPRYHAKHTGSSLADVMSSTIASALGCDANSSPIIEEIEKVLCQWLGKTLAISQLKVAKRKGSESPRTPIGKVFYNYVDVFLCLIMHCINRLEDNASSSGRRHHLSNREYVVYCSDDAFLPLEEACYALRVKLRKVITKSEDNYIMSAKNLEKQIEKDLERKMHPLLIVASFGSANIAADDDIIGIVEVANRKNMWVHVDATYGGCQWVEPLKRDGLHFALKDVNSVHVCFSTLFPFSGKVVIAWSADRLVFDNVHVNSTNFGENSLRLWLLIRFYGMKSIREGVKRKINLGNMFSDRVAQHSEFFNVFHENGHGVTLFQYENKNIKDRNIDANKLTSMFFYFVGQSTQMKFTLIKYHGLYLIRSCVNYERCNASMVEESVTTLLNIVEDFEESMKKKKNVLKETSRFDFVQEIGGSPNETTCATQGSDK